MPGTPAVPNTDRSKQKLLKKPSAARRMGQPTRPTPETLAAYQQQARELKVPHPQARFSGTAAPSLFDHREQAACDRLAGFDRQYIQKWLRRHEAHGRPLEVGANLKRETAQGPVYAVFCLSCKSGTCSWTPAAMYSESLGAWAIWVYPNHAHGEPRPPATDMEKAKRLGLPHPVVHTRRAASAPASLFDYRQQCAGGLSADESKRFIHDWLLSHDAHGQQLDASVAFKRKTSQGSIYSVYCFNCKPMTCKWSPAVMYSESLRSWAIWVYPSHRHGDPRTTATVTNKGGRPRHGMKPDRGQLHLLRHTGQPYTRRELHAWIKRTLLLEQQIIVRCRRGPAVEGTLEVYIRCACHRMDDGQRCVWTARMTYTKASGCGSLVGDAAERHGTQYLTVGKLMAQQRAVMHKLPG